MNGSRRKKILRRCAHCGRMFPVNPRAGRRHRFCSKPECVHASHLKSDRKWRRSQKGREYFKGWVNVDHVQKWRRQHPEYWRTRKRSAGIFRDALPPAKLRKVALQDMIDTHFSLVIGLIADRTNLALQDTMAFEIRRLMLLGQRILSQSKLALPRRPRRPKRPVKA